MISRSKLLRAGVPLALAVALTTTVIPPSTATAGVSYRPVTATATSASTSATVYYRKYPQYLLVQTIMVQSSTPRQFKAELYRRNGKGYVRSWYQASPGAVTGWPVGVQRKVPPGSYVLVLFGKDKVRVSMK